MNRPILVLTIILILFTAGCSNNQTVLEKTETESENIGETNVETPHDSTALQDALFNNKSQINIEEHGVPGKLFFINNDTTLVVAFDRVDGSLGLWFQDLKDIKNHDYKVLSLFRSIDVSHLRWIPQAEKLLAGVYVGDAWESRMALFKLDGSEIAYNPEEADYFSLDDDDIFVIPDGIAYFWSSNSHNVGAWSVAVFDNKTFEHKYTKYGGGETLIKQRKLSPDGRRFLNERTIFNLDSEDIERVEFGCPLDCPDYYPMGNWSNTGKYIYYYCCNNLEKNGCLQFVDLESEDYENRTLKITYPDTEEESKLSESFVFSPNDEMIAFLFSVHDWHIIDLYKGVIDSYENIGLQVYDTKDLSLLKNVIYYKSTCHSENPDECILEGSLPIVQWSDNSNYIATMYQGKIQVFETSNWSEVITLQYEYNIDY